MHVLTIRDVRLLDIKPDGDENLEVNYDTPISWPILWTKTRWDKHHGDVYLRIMAHGLEWAITDDDNWYADNALHRGSPSHYLVGNAGHHSQGGGGIQFCKENILLSTLSNFAPLKGLLKGIDLLACGAAYITPSREGREGDGNLLCYRLAQITQTYVRASTATQYYNVPGTIGFGNWEGTVITYGPTGAVEKVEHGDAAPASCPAR